MTWLLAAGLAVYPSTQLRLGGLPLGPGELLLLAWLGLAALRLTLAGGAAFGPALARISLFWLTLALALCAGAAVGFAREPFQYWSGIAHDVMAYTLLASLACMMAIDLAEPARRRRAIRRAAALGAGSMLLQMADAWGPLALPGVDPWFYDRLRGWSLDPNQLGFFALFVALLAVHLAETAPRLREALAMLPLLGVALTTGLLTRSDTFVVALMAAGSLYLMLKSVTWLRDVPMGPTLRGGVAALGLLSLPLAAASAAPFLSAAVERVEQTSAEVYAEDGQGDLRFHLWAEAWEKGLWSGLIGYGPGPHLTSKSWKQPPPYKFEAHNTSLDLLTQGGIVATSAFLLLCLTTVGAAWRARLAALAALVAGLAVFSMFHFVVRHPLFWFGVAVCLLEATRPARAGHAAAGEIRS
ncbi:O-antigen ligase family protein [Albimonas pacifica]|uniref:O-Antigen ligase n=1 Tax=Albimonas pacifica TaxID=1114924 RepID=A0A1I3IWQ6_9RHOB|nr:O-antigen ligase family protein [Albimonas pacifica]SFI52392.1 O-Antigen ligase [Albimonas pacifica]